MIRNFHAVSARKVIVIECDRTHDSPVCFTADIAGHISLPKARAQARSFGWTHVALDAVTQEAHAEKRLDLCPSCSQILRTYR